MNKLLILLSVVSAATFAQSVSLTFDNDQPGKPPTGFSFALTGRGKSGNWVVLSDTTAPSKPNVLAQTDMDETDYRFPLCVFDGLTAKDVDVSVRFKPVKGSVDQAGGIVWRYKDKNSYYILRANALEDNFRIYRVVGGQRRQFDGVNVKVTSNEWHTIRVRSVGNRFEAYFDGKKLIDATDNTFSNAGKVGLWTKADSYTLFDDFTVKDLMSSK